ncbi:MAG: hypothetical protein JRF33_19685 [Deltaproteobacteria bacterium]|nr:hypothetical protein [Deltaproteobacteria bacterium]
MVSLGRKVERTLGLIMLGGSWLGVVLSAVSVLVLMLLGADLHTWQLGLAGWWQGDWFFLRLLGGLGMLLLFATPVLMLVRLVLCCWSKGLRRLAFTGFGVLLVLGLSLGTVLIQL